MQLNPDPERNISEQSNDGSALMREAEALRALRSFPRAAQEYGKGLAQARKAPRIVNKMAGSDKRFRTIGYLLYLDADTETFGPQGGATYARLHDLCTRRQEVSPRTLKTMLALLKLSGFIRLDPARDDRRTHFYRPTKRMMSFVEQWLSYATRALDILEPAAGREALLRQDLSFIPRFLVSGGRDHAGNTRPADLMPGFISFFGGREGAASVIVAVMLDDCGAEKLPSKTRLAREYGLSKTQVLAVIEDGERHGYFTCGGNGVPQATPLLRDHYSQWVSIELAFYARHMRAAGMKQAGASGGEFTAPCARP
jgi:hypothetical protein